MKKSPQAFRTISEVANWLDTQTHVLRFWESKFKQIKPIKRAGRRYYRPQDMQVLGGIKALLHGQGLTIKHVQGLLAEQGISAVISLSPDLDFAGADKVEMVEEVVVEEVVANETVDEVVANETVDEVVANETINENESVNETITEVAEDLPPLLDAMGAPANTPSETPANTPTEILTDSPADSPAETPTETPADTPANTLTQDELKNIYHQLKDIRNRMGRSLAALSQ